MDADLVDMSKWLLLPLAVCGLLIPPLRIIPSHAFDLTWPVHARFHAIWGASKLFALGILQALLVLIPYSRGEPWSCFALAVIVVFGGMSIGMASRVAHGPVTPVHQHDRSTRIVIVCLAMSALGLALGVEPMFFAP